MNVTRVAGWMMAAIVVCAGGRGANCRADDRALQVKRLRCEYKVDPVGIDVRRPRFSWELESTEKNVLQTAYQVQVARSEKEFERPSGSAHGKGKFVWDSGEVKSDASVGVEYEGPALVSEGIYFWRVRVWDNHGLASE